MRFQGRTWQAAAVAGASVTLLGQQGQTTSMPASLLFADPAFAVVGSPAAAAAPQWGLLETLPERERAPAWQRHLREIETGLPDGPASGGVPTCAWAAAGSGSVCGFTVVSRSRRQRPQGARRPVHGPVIVPPLRHPGRHSRARTHQ
ncbi:hypothetical protein ABZ920_01320 [Streptomyces sp. NPDC046831]|uniref:hypothetical protein n=1 Tax=Streptomyces sp. NPDC046831 TaxID=3154805 RepID=UPI003407EC30